MNCTASTVETAAAHAAGNWMSFKCFVWDRADEIPDSHQWAIYYTHHRDSGLQDCSNARVIERALEPFTKGDDPDVVFEFHAHWTVGQLNGFSIRVLRNGRITEAFRIYHGLMERLAEHPILDEEHYSSRVIDATLDNILDHRSRLRARWLLPELWECDVYRWLGQHLPDSLANNDDQGGMPTHDQVVAAVTALKYPPVSNE